MYHNVVVDIYTFGKFDENSASTSRVNFVFFLADIYPLDNDFYKNHSFAEKFEMTFIYMPRECKWLDMYYENSGSNNRVLFAIIL